MGGFGADELVATSGGLVPLSSLGQPVVASELLELCFNDGSHVRCTPDQTFPAYDGPRIRADALGTTDRVVRHVEYVPRSECPDALTEAAVAVAKRSPLDLPTVWDEDLAYYLGWLVGDGSFSSRGAVTIYGSEADIAEVLPVHQALLTRWSRFAPKPSIQANGTIQLRLMRRDFVDYLSALGVAPKKSAEKVVPSAVLTAPEEALTAFLRGLFDADGCVVNDVAKGTRYVGLGSRSDELLRGVQALLASLDIWGRIYRTGVKKDSFQYTRKDGTRMSYSSSGPSFDLRITGRSLREFAVLVDFEIGYKRTKLQHLIDEHGYYDTRECVKLRKAVVLPGTHFVAHLGVDSGLVFGGA